jgi:tetratricopeptide (TPR) repeat protein
MSRKKDEDLAFEISFFESVLRREPHYDSVIEILGGLYTKTGRIADGLKMDRKLVRMRPDDATAHYNLACSLALMHEFDEALKTLALAISLGYGDAAWMARDPDLQCFKNHAAFGELLELVKQKQRENPPF